jgi:hypothetical protein
MNSQKWPKNTPVKALLLICIMIAIAFLTAIKYYRKPLLPERQPCMTIFVHGSFGTLLGFLSLTDLLKDRMSGTTYREVTKKMRMDDFFFKDQPILNRGLKQITPTMDPKKVLNRKYAIYPIAKAFQIIEQAIKPHKSSDLFYTFGWTGMMSQQSRRFESIRFYNALTEELARLKQNNIIPRIRLIAHSHGGNICLNLAAIHNIITQKQFDKKHQFSTDQDAQESIIKTLTIFETLGTKEMAKMRPDQKAFDYLPFVSSLHIDELIMLGTPIQPETEAFCYAPLFSSVYNIYSDEDMVQKIDWVSSKQALSNAKITKQRPKEGPANRVIQVKIKTHDAEQTATPGSSESEQPLLQSLLAGKNIFSRGSAAPTHKELWFLTWKNDTQAFNFPIAPLPVVTIVPMITHAMQKAHTDDATITLKHDKNHFSVIASDETKVLGKATIPQKLITALQAKTEPWAPADRTGISEFEAVYKHLTK